MTAYVIKRLLATIPVLMIVGLVAFSLVHLAPGDAANIMAGDYAGPEDVKRIRTELGLDKPLARQFVDWVGRTVRGDLGTSIFSGLSVSKLVSTRLAPTLSLALFGGLLAIALGVTVGVMAAWKAGTVWDRIGQVYAALGISVPGFWLGIVLIYIFAVNLRWFPVIGFTPITESAGGFFRSIALPCSLLGVTGSAVIVRMTRSSMLEVFREDYIRTARSKGLGERDVLLRHALRAAAIPIITVIGFLAAGLITGVVVTETVFTIPGLGRLVAESVQKRDFPIVQSLLMMLAFIYVLVNLAVDLAYAFVDPRVRL